MYMYHFSVVILYNFCRTGVIVRDSNVTIIGKGMFMNKGMESAHI